jgi:hypothetical protein
LNLTITQAVWTLAILLCFTLGCIAMLWIREAGQIQEKGEGE